MPQNNSFKKMIFQIFEACTYFFTINGQSSYPQKPEIPGLYGPYVITHVQVSQVKI